MTPASPPRIQSLSWTQELPADESVERAAAGLTAQLRAWDDRGAAGLFSPAVDRDRARRTLAHLALDNIGCTLERSWRQVEQDVLMSKTSSRSLLRCAAAPLELTFTLDDATGKVTSFSFTRARAFDATCWE